MKVSVVISQACINRPWCQMSFGALYFASMIRLLFPGGSDEMQPYEMMGPERTTVCCCNLIAFTDLLLPVSHVPAILSPVSLFRGDAGLAAANRGLPFERNPTSCHFSVPLCHLKWGEAQRSPCIYHTASATIINLTHHLPSLYNHLHLESLLGAFSFSGFFS